MYDSDDGVRGLALDLLFEDFDDDEDFIYVFIISLDSE